ncbi:MAG: ATP-binding protein [Polyangiaceae bacterium]|nr:ATP-binding protein [Polyangiaceae bacterium]
MATKTPCSTPSSSPRSSACVSGRIAESLPERLVLADKQDVAFDELLLMLLTDEITRRDNTAADNRAHEAGPRPHDAARAVGQDVQGQLRQTHAVRAREPALPRSAPPQCASSGPVGVGKTFVASALGHVACRHGYNVRFARADATLQKVATEPLRQLRDAEMIALTSVDLLIIDDFALEPMTKEESKDVYQLFLERTGRASMIVTSNRDTAEWLAMFDDVLLAQSAVDRFRNAAYDFVMEGESYRPRLKPTLDAAAPAACVTRHEDPRTPRARARSR